MGFLNSFFYSYFKIINLDKNTDIGKELAESLLEIRLSRTFASVMGDRESWVPVVAL
jgi:hypothetical protein